MNYKFNDKITNWDDEFNKKNIVNIKEKLYDSTFKNHYIKNKNVLACIIGPSGSGKTNSIIEYLKRTVNKNGYLPFFNIIYFSASTVDEDLLTNLKKIIGDGITLIDDVDDIPTLESYKDDKNKKEKRLLILDDINNLNKKQLEGLKKWFNSGRKIMSHIFCLNQNYTSCPVEIRRNCNYFFIFKSNDNTTINYMLRNHNIYNYDVIKFKQAYIESTKKKGDFLLVDLNDNSDLPLRHNFLDKINI